MANTEEILKAATDLGRMIAQNSAAKKFEDAARKLQEDTDAQRVLNDFNRHMQALQEKETKRQPIEVADKRKLEDLQGKVIQNKLVRDLQVAQMDFVDLMRRVDEAMQGEAPAVDAASGAAGAAQSPLVNPDLGR